MGAGLRRLVATSATLAVAGALSACAGSSGGADGATDGPVYESVEALTAMAEVVVLGAVGSIRGVEVEGGVDGIRVTFSSVTVDEVLAGRATIVQAGDVLAVGVSDEPSELVEGEEVVLFLEELTPADTPGIDTENPFYIIIGMEANGAFDVQDGAVIARSEQVRGMAEAGEIEGRFTTSLGDLRTFFSER